MPDTAPGSEYYDGYMAGTSFAEDAWKDIGTAAVWLDEHSLTASDVAIHKALLALPASIVENHTSVWIEAFRAGVSIRLDQYRARARQERENALLIGLFSGTVLLVVLSLALVD